VSAQLVEVRGERARKRQQMAVIFHCLSQGLPMVEYEASRELLQFLGVPKMPQRHWSDNSSWDMARHMNLQVIQKMKETIQATRYFAVSCDEVTTADNGTWISIHVYIVQNFERKPMLVALERVEDGATSNNLTKVVMTNVQARSGLNRDDIPKRMVCFGAGT
jgi:hypothetical protein